MYPALAPTHLVSLCIVVSDLHLMFVWCGVCVGGVDGYT